MAVRVLHISSNDHKGGCISALRIHLGLLKKGIDSHILFAQRKNPDIPNSHVAPRPQPSLIDRILYRLKLKTPLSAFHKKLLEGKPEHYYMFSFPRSDYNLGNLDIVKQADIIHLHWVSEFIDFPEFFSNIRQPVVWSLHDMNPFTGGCHHTSGCLKYRTDCADCPQLEGTIDKMTAARNLMIKQKALKNKRLFIVCIASWMKEHSQRSLLFKPYPHAVIHYGLDLNVFQPGDKQQCRSQLGLPQDALLLGFASGYAAYGKGFDLLYEAIQKIDMQRYHAKLCTVGKSFQLDNTSSIIQLDYFTTEEQMVMFYNAMDTVVIPSREDNFPNVMVEAMACGKPVFSFKTGGMMDVIQNGFNGFMAESMDPASLADILVRFLENPDLFDENIIRKFAEENFDDIKQSEKYIDVYQKMLANEKPDI